MARCAGFKPDNTPCERIVGASQTYCYSHDETRRAERKANASRAAKSKVSVEIRGIKSRLKELAEDVVAGEVDKGEAAVAGQLYGVLCRFIEAERKQRELEEFEERLEALEARQQEGHRWRA